MELFGLVILLSLPGYVVLQWYAAWKWQGGWRIAALVPLAIMGALVVQATVAFMAESNLWPLLLILTAPFACLYLLALVGARALAR
jgi:hypothetical protein